MDTGKQNVCPVTIIFQVRRFTGQEVGYLSLRSEMVFLDNPRMYRSRCSLVGAAYLVSYDLFLAVPRKVSPWSGCGFRCLHCRNLRKFIFYPAKFLFDFC